MDRDDIGNKVESTFHHHQVQFFTEVHVDGYRDDIANKVEKEYISPSSSTVFILR